MEKIYYRKLIRDKVPEKMTRLGVQYETRTLDDGEFRTELLKKPAEECSGLISAAETSKDELTAEMADVHDALAEIQKVFAITDSEIQTARTKNTEKKGGFDKRIFLEWSEDNGYQTNEKKGTDS